MSNPRLKVCTAQHPTEHKRMVTIETDEVLPKLVAFLITGLAPDLEKKVMHLSEAEAMRYAKSFVDTYNNVTLPALDALDAQIKDATK
jgi:hypothetical protein